MADELGGKSECHVEYSVLWPLKYKVYLKQTKKPQNNSCQITNLSRAVEAERGNCRCYIESDSGGGMTEGPWRSSNPTRGT